jgi:hypothetical protein
MSGKLVRDLTLKVANQVLNEYNFHFFSQIWIISVNFPSVISINTDSNQVQINLDHTCNLLDITEERLRYLLTHNSFKSVYDEPELWIFTDDTVKFNVPLGIIRNTPCHGQFTYNQKILYKNQLNQLNTSIIETTLKRDDYKSLSVALDIFLTHVKNPNITLRDLLGLVDPMDVQWHRVWITNLLSVEFDLDITISMSEIFESIGLFATTNNLIGILKDFCRLSRRKNIILVNRRNNIYTVIHDGLITDFSINRISMETYFITCEKSVFKDIESFIQSIS